MMHTYIIRPFHLALKRRRSNEEKGAAVVEGALVFGMFFLLIFGLIETGLYFMSWSTGRNATTEAAHQAALDGRSSDADYSALRSVKKTVQDLGGSFNYLIVYRANGIKDSPPQKCLDLAEAGRNDGAPDTPHGWFEAPDGSHSVETFDWVSGPRPKIACNIYYRSAFDKPVGAFIYDRTAIVGGADPSLDRFWPGGYRIDRLNGPVDFLGVYVSNKYNSTTGIIPSRQVRHNSIIQIESRRAN
jgi:TadE-like protein